MPKEAKSKKPNPKTVLDKVTAVLVELNSPGGSSRGAISKALKEIFSYENLPAVKTALRSGVTTGVLIQQGQRFWAASHPPPAPAGDNVVEIEDVQVGEGEAAALGCKCTMSYSGQLADGSQFDASQRFTFTLGAGEVIKGWEQGVAGMKIGGRRRLIVPSKLGYGKRGSLPEIPPDATLIFDIKLLSMS